MDGILGYLPGMVLCLAWELGQCHQGIMNPNHASNCNRSLGITVLMCVGSAIFAIQKVTRVDPAIVFKLENAGRLMIVWRSARHQVTGYSPS